MTRSREFTAIIIITSLMTSSPNTPPPPTSPHPSSPLPQTAPTANDSKPQKYNTPFYKSMNTCFVPQYSCYDTTTRLCATATPAYTLAFDVSEINATSTFRYFAPALDGLLATDIQCRMDWKYYFYVKCAYTCYQMGGYCVGFNFLEGAIYYGAKGVYCQMYSYYPELFVYSQDCTHFKLPAYYPKCISFKRIVNFTGYVTLTSQDYSKPIDVRIVNGWIILQQRIDNTLKFNQNWAAYRDGFGSYDSNYWIGLERMYELTYYSRFVFRLEANCYDGTFVYDEYNLVTIYPEQYFYLIELGKFSTGVYDIMNNKNPNFFHNSMFFSTPDRDYDNSQSNCANTYKSGWWFNSCFSVNLNGEFNVSFKYSSCFARNSRILIRYK